MDDQRIIRIDGLKWWVITNNGTRLPVPLCPDHDLRLTPLHRRVLASSRGYRDQYDSEVTTLQCAEGPHHLDIPRPYGDEKQYVIDRIDAKIFKGMKTIDLDGELTPIANTHAKNKDDKYFVTAQLMESKRGIQLVVYAGEKGRTKKAQIFIEPEVKRLAFDQNDLHPSDVFVELKAIFDDGSSHEMKAGPK